MNSSFNTTIEEFFPYGEPLGLRLYSFLIPILGFIAIILNSLVVYSSGLLIEMRQHPQSCYMIMGNLGLCNLCMSITVIFCLYYPSRNDLSCAFQIGIVVTTTLVSIYSVLLIAIDRFLYIIRGLQYQQYMSPNRVRLLTLLSWIVSISVGILPMFPHLRGQMNANKCWFILLTPELVLTTTIIGFTPIIVIFVLYAIILKKALTKVNELKNANCAANSENNLRFFRGSSANVLQEDDINENNSLLRIFKSIIFCWEKKSSTKIEEIRRKPPSRWKAIKVVFLTTSSFLITWVPYFIVSTMYVYCDHENNTEYCYQLKVAIAGPLAIIGFSNTILNPLIYCWWHNGFRKNSIRLISKKMEVNSFCQCCFKKDETQIFSESSRTTQLSNLTQNSIIVSNTAELATLNQ